MGFVGEELVLGGVGEIGIPSLIHKIWKSEADLRVW
jgi:hypothetical protein